MINSCLTLKLKYVAESGDQRSACREVMKTWIKSTHGQVSKTWREFVMVLHESGINYDNVIELLQEELDYYYTHSWANLPLVAPK